MYLDGAPYYLVPKQDETEIRYRKRDLKSEFLADLSLSEYHWEELWRSLILLLDFISTKVGAPNITSGMERIIDEV